MVSGVLKFVGCDKQLTSCEGTPRFRGILGVPALALLACHTLQKTPHLIVNAVQCYPSRI